MLIPILYEDRHLLVCVKPRGVLSESNAVSGMPDLLAHRQPGRTDSVFTVHRLDRDVGGLMLFSRDRAVTGKLTAQFAEHRVTKEYLAVVHGVPEAQGVWEDLLFRDARHNKTYVVRRPRKGVRTAKLAYWRLGTAEWEAQSCSLVRVRLFTGRTHQIRVQFASRAFPLLGDSRYGGGHYGGRAGICLWSHRLEFVHPVTGEPLSFTAPPPSEPPWTLFDPAP